MTRLARALLLATLAMMSPATIVAAAIGTIESLPTPAPAGSAEPRLTAGPDGALAMSWFEPRRPNGHRLRWAAWDGRRWSAAVTIAEGDSFFVNWADFPSIRWLGGARWAAHWLWKIGADTYAYEVRISFSEDGGTTWSRPIVPHRDGTATEHGFVSLVPESGNLRAVWLDGRNFAGHDPEGQPGADMTIRSARIGPDGAIEDEAVLDGRTCECCATAAVMTPRGLLVAYRDRDADEIRDIALVRREGGGWSAPAMVHDDGWIMPGCPVNGPALDAAGESAAIAWFTAAEDTPRVLAAWSGDGGATFGAPVRMDLGNPVGRAGVTMLPEGGALVTWIESGEKDARILARHLDPSGAPGAPIKVARVSAQRASGFPQIVSAGGRVYFAWTETGGKSRVRVAWGR